MADPNWMSGLGCAAFGKKHLLTHIQTLNSALHGTGAIFREVNLKFSRHTIPGLIFSFADFCVDKTHGFGVHGKQSKLGFSIWTPTRS